MSEAWRIEPEPTEEELAALMTAIVVSLSANAEPAPEPPPASKWTRAARREALESRIDSTFRWLDHS